MLVRSASQPSAAAPNPESPNAKPKNRPGDRADLARHQLLRIDDDRREGRRQCNPMKTDMHPRPEQIRIGQRQREGQSAENREPDHVLASESVAEQSAREACRRRRGEEQEQIELRRLQRHVETVDQIERVIAARCWRNRSASKRSAPPARQNAPVTRRATGRADGAAWRLPCMRGRCRDACTSARH